MEWNDDAVVLSARSLGETSLVVSALTCAHGRHNGLVRGGTGRRAHGVLQPGNRIACRWRGRTAEQLGSYSCEPVAILPPAILDDAARLAAVVAACAILDTALPEREPAVVPFAEMLALLQAIEEDPAWPCAYVRWEVALLADLGFGLDLAACALTGAREDLAYVSPRTGRAVAAAAAGPWQQRLLALPAFLCDAAAPATSDDVLAGLALAGYFLRRCVYAEHDRDLPSARQRLSAVIGRSRLSCGDAAGAR